MKRFFIVLFSFITFMARGEHVLQFIPVYKGVPIELGKNQDEIQIETFRFYISHLQLLHNERSVWTSLKNAHLIDLDDSQSLSILVSETPKKVNAISFALGIDSLTNVSGVMGGDLDPTKGMYWSWQSGYINFKLEGDLSAESKVSSFAYHLGGYSGEKNCIQFLQFNLQKSDTITIEFDIHHFLTKIDDKASPTIMSPSVQAVAISKIAASSFKIHASN